MNINVYIWLSFQVCLFPNLERLTLSSQHMSEEVVLMLAGAGLPHLTLTQDQYTTDALTLPYHVWKEARALAPHLKVALECRGKSNQEILIQERAPVYEVVYDTPYSEVSPLTVLSLIEHYGHTLEVYAHKGLPRRHGSRSFHDRVDSSIVLLIRNCKNIHTLVIRDRISSCTLLILATEAKKLQKLHVRRNAILKRFDWPKSDGWSNDFYALLKECSGSMDLMEQYVSSMLGYRWCPLSDKAFKDLKVV